MAAAKKKSAAARVIVKVGSRIFIVSPLSLARVAHRKRSVLLSGERQSTLALLGKDLTWTLPDCLLFYNAAIPLGLGSCPRSLASPRRVYSVLSGFRVPASGRANLGGRFSREKSYSVQMVFDGYKFYSGFMLRLRLFKGYQKLSDLVMRLSFPSRRLISSAVYSRFTNYMFGVLGSRSKTAHNAITLKGRATLRAFIFFRRSNTDSFW